MVGVVRRGLGAFSDGVLGGAAAALLGGLADYGAHWLFLETWPDRGALLIRTLATLVPLGALAGAVVWPLLLAGDGLLARRLDDAAPRRAALVTALCAPGALLVGPLLFSGGMMSRLPGRSWLVALTVGVLLTAVALGVTLALRLHERVARDARGARRLAIGAGIAGLLLGKIDQHVLPKLYDYLHGLLTVATFVAFAAAVALGWRALGRRAPRWPRSPLVGVTVAAALAVVLQWHVETLDQNQNVRVAMMHPNCGHTRSAMQVLGPVAIAPREAAKAALARARAREARARLRQGAAPAVVHGPTVEDAHVLLVTIDALRADHLGMYGYTRPTSPKLDAWSKSAVVFDRAYAPAPHSSYSLSSVMTSEYLHETLDLGKPPPEETLASVLASAGYHTAAFYTQGIFHTAGERLHLYATGAYGYALHDHTNRPAEQMTDRVLEEVDRIVARGEPSSLFWVHYFDVHEPYVATTFGTSQVDRYDSEILSVDGAVTRLVREMEKRLDRPVVVAITADHGEEFREHGGVYHGSTLYEEQIRVPLMLKVPGMTPHRVSQAVETIDLAPTLLGLLGLDRAPSMRGRDLRDLASGEKVEPRSVFAAVIHKKMVLRWPYKLIADLRFGLFELYDLEHDPRERTNLADKQPELLEELKAEVYAWLDSLGPEPVAEQSSNPVATALDRGRLGDRRAVEPLANALVDEELDTQTRVEAARLLGTLADKRATQSLVRTLAAKDDWVAAEAAIALGRMYDGRARDYLRRLVVSEDQDVRTRAAVSLGRLRDVDAVPGLIDALWVAPNGYERDEAVRWLGRLRDSRALDPLIELLPEVRTRYLVVIAMGQIGDPRAYEPLVDVLGWEHHPNVRDNVVRGLGLLGDPRALDVIVPLALSEPTLKNVSESLVRLDAIQAGRIGGTDLAPKVLGLDGFERCESGPLLHDWDYRHRTRCTTLNGHASLSLRVPEAIGDAPTGATAVLALRRSDDGGPADVRLRIGEVEVGATTVDGKWGEYRFDVPAGVLSGPQVRAQVESSDASAHLTVDHLLLYPRPSTPGA